MSGSATVGTSFVPRLAGFVAFLRLRGVSVGIGAEIDCAEALQRIAMLDRDAFLEACKVTLAKSPVDLARLEDAFDAYWKSLLLNTESERSLPLTVSRRPPRDGVLPWEPTAPVRVSEERKAVVRVGVYSPDAPSPGHALTLQDRRRIASIRAGVRRFRRYAATLPGRRHAVARRGGIDFQATARHSLRQGGEWVDFRFRRRKTLRAEFVVLWDVSGSMRDHDGRLFAIVHAMQRVVRRTRVFAFGTHLDEITSGLQGKTYAAAANSIAIRLGSIGGGTRIGPCLEDFIRRYGGFVHPWTTVVILSDGWDLGDTAVMGQALAYLRRRVHKLVWVNPYADEPRFEPATAGMREAMPHLDLLLAPSDFEATARFAPERIAARRPAAWSKRWGKAFIGTGPSAPATS